VILAVPAYVRRSLLRGVDTRCRRCATASPTRRPRPSPSATGGSGIAPSDAGHRLRRAARGAAGAAGGTWVSSKWPGRAPDGHVLLRGFLGGGRDPHRLDQADDELIEAARGELAELLGIAGPGFARLFRWTRRARSTKSVICSAWPPSSSGSRRSPASSSPAAASAPSASPTASPTDGQRRHAPLRSSHSGTPRAAGGRRDLLDTSP
jgi:hypothetical protein